MIAQRHHPRLQVYRSYSVALELRQYQRVVVYARNAREAEEMARARVADFADGATTAVLHASAKRSVVRGLRRPVNQKRNQR